MAETDDRGPTSIGARVAVIGGSGFYRLDGLTDIEEVRPETPFGPPSDAIVLGALEGERLAFLPRHGVGHRLLPSEVPARANIFALKALGVEFVIGVNAVGSLREEIQPLHLVLPDQLIDRTRGRPNTFFGRGLVAHVPFAEPFCPQLREALAGGARQGGNDLHEGGTYVVIEGPAFSSRAESDLYRSWGADVIGMTALPEAKLAREAEMCYAVLASVTDYDCWHPRAEAVTAEMIVTNLRRNVAACQETLRRTLPRLPARRDCPCPHALADALVTPPHLVAKQVKETLAPIIGRYMSEPAKEH